MKRKIKQDQKEKPVSSSKKKTRQSHEFETMSQVQNRYGKGRQQNGSDGGSGQPQGSNH